MVILLETPDYVTTEMAHRYVSRALRGYAKFDPEKLFEKGDKPGAAVMDTTNTKEDVELIKNYMKVTHRLRGAPPRVILTDDDEGGFL